MAKEYMLRSNIRGYQSNDTAVGLSTLEANTDLMAGMIASLNSDLVVHGIVNEGHNTLPLRREGTEK